MSLQVLPVQSEAITAFRLEALLAEAVRIADRIGYDLTAIRIEEAIAAIHDRHLAAAGGASLPLN
ncbi:hypothetical protein FHT00_001934 [Sphingomonas insulae]|nr:hypothetical protein [Sphingomonas insulae]NIJ29987.1 hypothetical protein [Sphingomonas insulae]